MPTPPTSPGSTTATQPLRLELRPDSAASVDGVWWPRSRDLSVEGADLVDHFPASGGRISRLLFSRPDWDDATTADGRGLRRIDARRGRVKSGSFPRDDTHLMVLTMSTGERLRLEVVPSDVSDADGEHRLRGDGRADGS